MKLESLDSSFALMLLEKTEIHLFFALSSKEVWAL